MRNDEIIIAGFGGQGIMFSGTLLAQAAMQEGLNVTFFPSYGAEMRGGTANCTVIISGTEIGSPVSSSPSTLIAMNQASYDKYAGKVRTGGLILCNSSLIHPAAKRDVRLSMISATEISDKLGFSRGANLVILGAYVKITGIVAFDSMMKALSVLLKEREKILGINQEMLKAGFSHGS